MELKLINGRYETAPGGGLAAVSGAEELAQRITMKLTARRGTFWPMPDYGSELYRLISGEKASDRESAVRQYVAEALDGETGTVLTGVNISYPDAQTMALRLDFEWLGGSFAVNMSVKEII